jgi:Nucleotidyltransferase of unknown function (DUF6036)
VRGRGLPFHEKHKVYLQKVTVANLPDSHADRLTEMFAGTFRRLRLFALDPYDLALSKLERNSPRDREDVLHLARVVPLDLDTLRTRDQDEMQPCLGNVDREDLTLELWIEMVEEERQRGK